MPVAQRQGREKPAKIEQRKVKGRSGDWMEDLGQNKQHSWLAQFTYGRPRGRKKHVKRRARGPGVALLLVGSACPHTSRMYFPAIF